MLTRYERGTASVAFGSNTVTGLDTYWSTYLSPGDILHVGGDAAVILSLESPRSMTLTETWTGATVTNGAYWVEISPDNLARAKVTKKNAIDRERAVRCCVNVTVLGHTWQADLISQDLLNKAVMLANNGLGLPPVWRDVDNVNVTIESLSELLAVAGAIGAQTQAAYTRSWEMKAAVDAATTVEAVNAVSWE